MSNARAYYNEIDPFAAQWLRNLIDAGHIAPGDVDERSIVDVRPDDLRGYTQCHFFAGIGGWSYALRLAGWPDDRPVWTGSCPCQPFSAAGQRKGEADERHLWPDLRRLVANRAPSICFGEQVASADGRSWLAGVRSDLETLGYRVGAADLCAAGVAAPHARQRLYWMAISEGEQSHGRGASGPGRDQSSDGRDLGGMADADGRIEGDGTLQRSGQHGFWSQDAIAISCTDGHTRRAPAEPAFQPMADGISGRLQQLRAYGNAIVPQVAAQFILAATEAIEG